MKAVPAYAQSRRYKPGQLLTITIALSSILGLIAAYLQIHIIPVNAAVVACSTTNIAFNHPTTASSVQNSALSASNVVDGNFERCWSSTSSDPQWLLIDLGSVQKICRVVLSWEMAYGKAYQIQISNDIKTWTPIYSTGSGNGSIETLDISGSGRYIRMYGTRTRNSIGLLAL